MKKSNYIVILAFLIPIFLITGVEKNFILEKDFTYQEKTYPKTSLNDNYYYPLNELDKYYAKERGTHSNFSTLLINDGIFDNLTETNSNNETYEILGVDYFDATYTDWTEYGLGGEPYIWSENSDDYIVEYSKNSLEGWFYFENTTATGSGLSTNIVFWCYAEDSNDYFEVYIDYTGSGAGALLGSITPTTSSYHYESLSLGSRTATELDNTRIYVDKKSTGASNDIWIKYACLNVSNEPLDKYELDLEIEIDDWFATQSADNVELCIYTGTLGNENISVQILGDVPRIYYTYFTNLTSNSWNNVSIKDHDTQVGNEILRIYTPYELSDSIQNSWLIDVILIHTWDDDVADTDPPTWDTLTESADPLELGSTETININVYDASTISNVYLEFDGSNHSMSFISGDTYSYSTWTPTSVGLKNYSIWLIDEYNNINWTGIFNITVIDTTNPIISDVVESADPLTLGNNETITCNVSDFSALLFVYLEFDSSNHSMTNIYGITYSYWNWKPISIGLKNYTIWVKDDENNVGYYSSNITVILITDTDPPTWDNLTEITDPIELGLNITILINVYDESNITSVLIKIKNVNYTMTNIYNDTYSYSNWIPTKTGKKRYTIYMTDEYNNVDSVSGSIKVVNTPNLIMSIFLLSSLSIGMIYFYIKLRVFLIILTVFLFSVVFGITSLGIYLFPFTPYLQVFFIVFQSTILLKTSLETYEKR